ncbi:MAG: hypothetical protein M3483_03115 [Gemmatimonadota bacterium]|nr:hypothetical protein [Gemmatimonadota bacterium]
MKRLLTSALVAAMVAAGTGSEAQAQMMGRRASLFDLGLYGGGAWTSAWFKDLADEGYQVGFAPIFGLTATYWATQLLGVRYHTAYMPSRLPQADTELRGVDRDAYVMNNWFFDLNLAFRPWISNLDAGNLMASTYFFLGGGALVTNIAGDPAPRRGEPFPCIDAYRQFGICLSQDPEYAVVGQGNVGVGFDLFPVSSGVGIFGELGVHGYDSPAHDVTAASDDNDKFAFTPRGVLGVKFMFGDLTPPLPPPPPVMPPLPPPPAPSMESMQVCVVQGGALSNVTVQFNRTTGDTMVAGQRFSAAYPATAPNYVAGETYFINNQEITVMDRAYVKYGLPRVIGANELTRVGEYSGTPVFAQTGATGRPDVIYLPIRPGCEFQPYNVRAAVEAVRG